MVTAKEFIDAMKKAVEERGADFVYPQEWLRTQRLDDVCLYFIEDENGVKQSACIIGKALEIATGTVYTGPNDSAGDVLQHFIDPSDPNRKALLRAAESAQTAQDLGIAWGEVLEDFLSNFEEQQDS